MRQHPAELMLWMGDNIYLIFGQWKSRRRIVREYVRTRNRHPIEQFLMAYPHYATWDDHDYGPNNTDGDYHRKGLSLDAFKTFWANPYYGGKDKDGVYTHFRQGDAEFFMLDSRYHCTKKEGCMLGDPQMQWLQEKLLASTANFKFIVCGSQILSEDPLGENFAKHPFERQQFLDFLSQNKIKGVIFLSGDRHFTELSCLKRPGVYPLYEYTCSPMTSFIDPFYSKTNPIRVDSTFVRTQNFGKISLLGQGVERRCRIETYSAKGKLFWARDLYLKDLQ
jgi:alkaline phosphatase D